MIPRSGNYLVDQDDDDKTRYDDGDAPDVEIEDR